MNATDAMEISRRAAQKFADGLTHSRVADEQKSIAYPGSIDLARQLVASLRHV